MVFTRASHVARIHLNHYHIGIVAIKSVKGIINQEMANEKDTGLLCSVSKARVNVALVFNLIKERVYHSACRQTHQEPYRS